MSRIIEEVEVDVPLRIAYDQWSRFESFPRFMETVDRVVQVDERTLDWTATIAGRVKHWRAEIVDQRPDELIAWRSTDGARNDGEVRFEARSAETTLVILQLDVEPEGLVERAGDALGVLERRVRGDLLRFRDFVEAHGRVGGWPEEVGAHRA
jgi:uncharacterized membrane protein